MPRSPRFDGDVWSASEIYTPSDENGGDTGGGGGDEGGDFVDTSGKAYLGVEHLRTREFHEPTHLAYILYLASEGDGGDGWFFYDDASFLADDGVDTIKPHNVDDSDPGRWRRKS
jgi:hypothetical protein